jgi:hypothetical protein
MGIFDKKPRSIDITLLALQIQISSITVPETLRSPLNNLNNLPFASATIHHYPKSWMSHDLQQK